MEQCETAHVVSVPLSLAERIAEAGSSLLITGETGVGKGFLTSWIHEHSRRSAGPFVPVNCGAIPDGVIDSHLFGHARGAFSDAHRDHGGLVRAAHGGTLFLDEVGALPLQAQVRLLRLLEEREIQPVGTAVPVRVDVRIIAATAADLREMVREGTFRPDLFYRLNVIHLELKPLRNRLREIPDLVATFNAEFAERGGRAPLAMSDEAMRFMLQQDWPGNVRQLRSVMERLHVLCPHDDVVSPADLCEFGGLDAAAPRPAPRLARPGRLREARLEVVHAALASCGGNISRAATALGVHRSTVHRWLAS